MLSGLRKPSASTLDSAPCSLASGRALSKLSWAPLALAVPSRSPRALPANWATLREHAKALDLFSSLLPLSRPPRPRLGCFVLPEFSGSADLKEPQRCLPPCPLACDREHQWLSKKAPSFKATVLIYLKPRRHHISLKTKKNVGDIFAAKNCGRGVSSLAG